MKKMTFYVKGMTCDHCAKTVEKALLENPKILSAEVSFDEGIGEIAATEEIPFSKLKKSVQKAGYDLEPIGTESVRTPPSPGPFPMDSPKHVVIIGAGSGAFAAAIRASELGAKVTLIERWILGGTCVNVGCIPSKILIRQAHHVHQPMSQPFEGIVPTHPAFSDIVLKRQREERVLQLRDEKYTRLLQGLPNVTLLEGFASFQNSRTVHVRMHDGSELLLAADHILIATGARPSVPNIPGLLETPYWTSTEALFADKVPSHLLILGGGFVAVEIGQAYRRLGAQVTIIERNTQILNRMEPDLGKGLQSYLEAEGIRFLFNADPRKVSYSKNNGNFHVVFDGLKLEGDALLVATGRTPNTRDLSLEKAGVLTDSKGAVIVNEHLETNVPGIYAVGDCTNLPKFVYVAAAAGTRAATNMLEPEPVSLDLSNLPEVIFTDPQVAVVGLTESEALSHGLHVESRILSLDQVPRALANFDTRGWVKMVAEQATGRLVGVQILAPEGGEVIQTAAMAIAAKRTVREIGDQLFPYLTMVESLKLCAQSFHRDVKQLSCCAG